MAIDIKSATKDKSMKMTDAETKQVVSNYMSGVISDQLDNWKEHNGTAVMTAVSEDVYEQLKVGNVVKPILLKGASERTIKECTKAYDFLKQCSQKDAFFFGMLVNTYDRYLVGHKYAKTHSSDVIYQLTLNIPDNELFKHLFYNFSEYLYYTGIATEEEVNECPDYFKRAEAAIANSVLTGSANDNAIQVIYDRIDPKWILDVNKVDLSQNPDQFDQF